MRQQRPGDTGEETADKERRQFIAEEVDAHHLGGQVVITDSDECPPDPCPDDIFSDIYGDERDDENQEYIDWSGY